MDAGTASLPKPLPGAAPRYARRNLRATEALNWITLALGWVGRCSSCRSPRLAGAARSTPMLPILLLRQKRHYSSSSQNNLPLALFTSSNDGADKSSVPRCNRLLAVAVVQGALLLESFQRSSAYHFDKQNHHTDTPPHSLLKILVHRSLGGERLPLPAKCTVKERRHTLPSPLRVGAPHNAPKSNSYALAPSKEPNLLRGLPWRAQEAP